MRCAVMLGSSLAVALLASGFTGAEEFKSGPPVGSSKIAAFNPLHVNGETPDKKVCLV